MALTEGLRARVRHVGFTPSDVRAGYQSPKERANDCTCFV